MEKKEKKVFDESQKLSPEALDYVNGGTDPDQSQNQNEEDDPFEAPTTASVMYPTEWTTRS